VVALPLPSLAVDRRAQDPLAALKRFLDTSNLRVMVAAESPGRRETMATYFAEHGLKPGLCGDFQEFQSGDRSFVLCVSPLARGFMVPAEGWAVVTEAELYAAWSATARARRRRALRSRGCCATCRS